MKPGLAGEAARSEAALETISSPADPKEGRDLIEPSTASVVSPYGAMTFAIA